MTRRIRHGLLIVAVVCLGASARAQAPEAGEGYDENTTITIRGAVREVVSGPRGPVRLVLEAANARYTIITAPSWFLVEEGVSFVEGAAYEITGSKLVSREGVLHLVAKTLKDLATGKVTRLRDEQNRPLWRGGRHRMPDRQRQGGADGNGSTSRLLSSVSGSNASRTAVAARPWRPGRR